MAARPPLPPLPPGPRGPGHSRGHLAEPDTEALPLVALPNVAARTPPPPPPPRLSAGRPQTPPPMRSRPPQAYERPELPPPARPAHVADDDAPLTALPGALGAEVTGAPPADTPSGAARTSRAGRNMAAAVGVGAGMGGLVIATLLIYRPAFLVVLAAAVVISVTELVRALDRGGYRAPLPPVLVGSLLMLGLAWFRGPSGLAVAFLLTVFAVLLWRLGDGPIGYLRDASAAVFVALYVPLLAGFCVLLLAADDGAARVLLFVATVVCSDVGGFAAGVAFGRHPMAASISPKKSWEGFAGSVLACVAFGSLIITVTFHGPWWGGLVFGVVMAATATLGDLAESLVKRDLGIKDMGTLLPGHGGLMDRMDSLLPSAAVAYLLLSVIVPG